MTQEVTIGYLTASVKVTKNNLMNDEVIWRKRRSIGQMFFQPYESKEEFIYCARHIFLPITGIGVVILVLIVIVTVPVLIGGLPILCAALGGISTLCGNEIDAAFFLGGAEFLIKCFCQALIDLVV